MYIIMETIKQGRKAAKRETPSRIHKKEPDLKYIGKVCQIWQNLAYTIAEITQKKARENAIPSTNSE